MDAAGRATVRVAEFAWALLEPSEGEFQVGWFDDFLDICERHGMRVISQLALAPNQRVLTVEVGSGDERRWLVLGVTPGGISNLHTMPPQGDAVSAHATPALPFASWLAKSRGAANSGDERAS